MVWEFPKHYLSATYSYDVMSPMDKFLFTDKDNIFLSVKTTTVDQMSYMRDATINYELETLTGFGVKAMLRHRNDEPTGKLEYLRNDAAQTRVHDVTTSEASLTLRYAPGESFVNSKQRRVPVSLDAPIFTLTHARVSKEYWVGITTLTVRKQVCGNVSGSRLPGERLIAA